jgi:integrase
MPGFAFKGRRLPKPPPTGQVDHWDKALPSFGMRVSSGGARTWVVMYRYNGIKRRMKLGRYPLKSLADARDEAREALRKAEKGLDPAAERKMLTARAETVQELADLYIEQYAKKRKRSWYKDDQILKREVLPVIGRKRIIDVTRQDVREILQQIMDREAPIRANHTLEVVRKMYNWAIETRDLSVTNPAALMTKPGKAHSRRRYLKGDEMKLLWASFTPQLLGRDGPAAFMLLALTAQREMEVLRMRWTDVDFEELVWTIPADHAKNELEHVIPITPFALGLLRQLRERAGPKDVYVFQSPVLEGDHVRRVFIEKRIKKLRNATGIKDVTPHDLRRTVTTYFGKLRVPQLIKKRVLNHAKMTPGDVTEIYDRYEYLEEKREALLGWERLLMTMVAEKADTEGMVEQVADESSNVIELEHVRA